MRAQEVLPPDHQKRYVKPEQVILAFEDAFKALDALVQAQWAMVSWKAKILNDHGELRNVYLPALARWWSFDWKRGEPWEHYVTASAQLCRESLQHFKSVLDQRPGKPEHMLYISSCVADSRQEGL